MPARLLAAAAERIDYHARRLPGIDLSSHDTVCVCIILKSQLHLPAEVRHRSSALLHQAAHNVTIVNISSDQGHNRLHNKMQYVAGLAEEGVCVGSR